MATEVPFDFLHIVVSREEVEAGDLTGPLESLRWLTASPSRAREFFERVDIAFSGYDDDEWELFEIPDVRQSVEELDEKFPFWLFFLSKYHLGLQCLFLCLLPPDTGSETQESKRQQYAMQLLMNRWVPYMNYMCEFAGLSESQIESLTNRSLEYITKGRFRPGEQV